MAGQEWRHLDVPLSGIDRRSAPPHARGSLICRNYEFDRTGGLRQRRGTLTKASGATVYQAMAAYRGQSVAFDADGNLKVWELDGGLSPSLGRVSPVAVRRMQTLASFDMVARCPSVVQPDPSGASAHEYVVTWCDESWTGQGGYVVLDRSLKEVVLAGNVGPLDNTHCGPVRWAAGSGSQMGVVAVGIRNAGVTELPLRGCVFNVSTRAVTTYAMAGAPVTKVDTGTGIVSSVSYDADGIAGAAWFAVVYVDAAAHVQLSTYSTNGAFTALSGPVDVSAAAVPVHACAVSAWYDGVTYRVAVLYPTPAKAYDLTLQRYTVNSDGTGLAWATTTNSVLAGPVASTVEQLTVHGLSATETYCAATTLDTTTATQRTFYYRRVGATPQRNRTGMVISQRLVRSATNDLWQPVVHLDTETAPLTMPRRVSMAAVWALVPLGTAQSLTEDVPMYACALRGDAYGPGPAGSVGRGVGQAVVAQMVRQRTISNPSSGVEAAGAYISGAHPASVALLSLDWQWQDWFTSAALGSYLFTSGGQVGLFDGARLVEAAFAWRPEWPSLTTAPDAGGLVAGSYIVRNTHAWWDAIGGLHVSEPSPARTVSFAEARRITLSHYNLSLTRRTTPLRTVCGIEWRTEKDGSTLYRVSDSPFATALPDGGGALLTAQVDTLADTSLEERAILYTDTGELAHDTPPSARHVAVAGRRVWLSDCEVETEVWYSQPVGLAGSGAAAGQANEGMLAPSWSAALVLRTDSPCRATAALADKVVLLCDRDIYVVAGDGPGRDGIGAFQIQKLITGLGVARPQSVVSAPDGVYFVTDRGMYRLGLDMALSPVGAIIQPYLDSDNALMSPVVLPERHQIIWVRRASHDFLLYDYLVGQWAQWVLKAGWPHALAALEDGTLWMAADDGAGAGATVLQVTLDGTVSDPSGVPAAVVQTPWLHVGGVQGWQRLRRAGITGTGLGGATMAFDFRRDYNDVAGTPISLVAPAGAQHAQVRAPVQRAEAFSLSLSTTQAAGAPHELWGVTLEYGALPGMARRPATEKK